MKITIVSVRSTPWEMDGRAGVSVRADAILEIEGSARVCRIKLPRDMAGLQPGNYQVEAVPYVDKMGMLSFRMGHLRPLSKAESDR